MNRAHARRELLAGGLLFLIGIGVTTEARRHAIGTLSDMEAGYFPLILGMLLVGLGVLTAVAGLIGEPSDGQHGFVPIDLRGIVAIVASVVAFAVLGTYAGLLPATFFAALVAAAGDRKMSLKGALLLALALSFVAVTLFSYALKMPFPLVRW